MNITYTWLETNTELENKKDNKMTGRTKIPTTKTQKLRVDRTNHY